MIYISLFLSFFLIGAVSFGGGYGMISIIIDTVTQKGWLTESEVMNFIAVSESTPGPLAVNMATFIGSSQAGFLGSFVATLGVILPSFIIILLISIVLKNLLKYWGVQSFLNGVRPAVVALIISTGITMAISSFFSSAYQTLNYKAIVVFLLLVSISLFYKIAKKKRIQPIAIIIISAILGIVFYS